MDWEWSATFRGLVSGTLIWAGVSLRKKIIPFIKVIKKFSKLVEKVEELEAKVVILESRSRGMYDIVREPIYELNEKGEVIYANNAWAKMIGLSDPRDGYGFSYVEMLWDEDEMERVEKISARLKEHHSPTQGLVYFKHQISELKVTAEYRTAIISDKDKKPTGTIGRLYIIEKIV